MVYVSYEDLFPNVAAAAPEQSHPLDGIVNCHEAEIMREKGFSWGPLISPNIASWKKENKATRSKEIIKRK